ncbi:MAG: hypothetical protein ABIP55_15635 [Tepidisphaeraceae bacterium]
MIQFTCHCQVVLEVADDRAGSSIQCPQCGRLVDVPTLGDIHSIIQDGTYRIGDVQTGSEIDALADMQRAFSRQRLDEAGREKDLRMQQDDFATIGESIDPLGLVENPQPDRAAPKYDPVTGELIRELDIKDDRPRIDPDSIPIASAVINYARDDGAHFSAARIIPELFKFTNLIVILVIFLFHVFLQMTLMTLMAGIFLLAPVFVVLWGLLMSHYAVIVEDIGVEEKDELPRPLRDFDWHDDLWGPFVQFFGSLLLCYGPILAVLWMPPPVRLAFIGAAFVCGTIAFPAVLLTLTTSGTWINLSPDRLLRVMRFTGGSYVIAVVLWGVAAGGYVLGIIGTVLAMVRLFLPVGSMPWYLEIPVPIAYPMLLGGIFLMHGFVWYLGLMYRPHHESFGWAYQRHIRRPERPHRTRTAADSVPQTREQSRRRLQGENAPRPIAPVRDPR